MHTTAIHMTVFGLFLSLTYSKGIHKKDTKQRRTPIGVRLCFYISQKKPKCHKIKSATIFVIPHALVIFAPVK